MDQKKDQFEQNQGQNQKAPGQDQHQGNQGQRQGPQQGDQPNPNERQTQYPNRDQAEGTRQETPGHSGGSRSSKDERNYSPEEDIPIRGTDGELSEPEEMEQEERPDREFDESER